MRQRLFRKLGILVADHPGKIMIASIFFTLFMAIASGKIAMKTQMVDMLPKGIPQAKQFQKITDKYGTASTIMIAIEDSTKNIETMKQCAEAVNKAIENLTYIVPAKNQKIRLFSKIKIMKSKDKQIAGVMYDTIKLVKRVDYKADNNFFQNHGMMTQKTKDLKNFIKMFSSISVDTLIENINNNFEAEYIDDTDNMSTFDGESQAVQGLDGIEKFVESISEYLDNQDTSSAQKAINRFLSGPEYFVSPDNTTLLMMLQPNVSFNEFDASMNLGSQVKDSIDAIQKRFPNLYIGASGGMVLQVDENRALQKDFGWSSLIALLLILVLLIGSFGAWKNPFYSVVTLVVSLIWVTGILAIVLHFLNAMSASFGIILIGLGIDFGIHFISGFRDGREMGLSVRKSIINMYEKVGTGVVTGAMTTAAVFYALAITRFAALTEMGIAVGTGILVTLFAMMVLLPTLISWDNKGYSLCGKILRKLHLGFIVYAVSFCSDINSKFFNLLPFKLISNALNFSFMKDIGKLISNTNIAVVVLIISIIVTIISFQKASGIGFEYNMMKLEPKGIQSAIVQDMILDKFEMSPDYSMLITDSEKECREVIKKYKKLGKNTGIIGSIDGITELVPEEVVQVKNKELVKKFAGELKEKKSKAFTKASIDKLKKELRRLHANIVEIGELSLTSNGEKNKIIRKCDEIVGKKDVDSKILAVVSKLDSIPKEKLIFILNNYQKSISSELKSKLLRMTNDSIVTIPSLPSNIKERYISKDGKSFMVSIFPKSNIWNQKNLQRFNTLTANIDERITGVPQISLLFIDLMKERCRIAIIAGAIAIFVILLIDFRSLGLTLLAMVPLVVGSLWMVGLMALFSMKFNYTNFMALPLILGIGIDDGVHILHRYKIEGRGSIKNVMHFTGRAILLTSLTTMIGFGSMGLASHRGIASMGQVLFMGVGSCFVSSTFVLLSMIVILEKISTKFNGGK